MARQGRRQRGEAVAAQDLSGAARSLLWSGVLLGIGVAGTLDEVVFHQLLRWHNFYVHTTLDWRIVSDGLFHAFSSLVLVLAAWRLWRQPRLRNRSEEARVLLAGTLLGAGGFNFYDGTIQHKLLRLHPIREGVANQLPYDLAWNMVALAVFFAGWWLWRNAQARQR
jgi:uncharacterized membrane protein